jgi:hypothetical protein
VTASLDRSWEKTEKSKENRHQIQRGLAAGAAGLL